MASPPSVQTKTFGRTCVSASGSVIGLRRPPGDELELQPRLILRPQDAEDGGGIEAEVRHQDACGGRPAEGVALQLQRRGKRRRSARLADIQVAGDLQGDLPALAG